VLTTLDRYLLRRIVATALVILLLGLMAVMLERVLAVLRLVGGLNDVLGYLGQMLILLAPHYLGLVLPAAFFLGVLLTLGRLSRDSELAVMFAAGMGLPRVLAPILGLAAVLMVISTIILGYLSPYTRYAYRSFKHVVTHASLALSVKEKAFIQVDDVTFFVTDTLSDGDRLWLSKVFVHRQGEDGGSVVTTANRGVLVQLPDDGGSALVLLDGERTETAGAGGPGKTLVFDELRWPIGASEDEQYGPRGRDRRELTLDELWTRRGQPSVKPDPAEIDSELQLRLVIIATIPILPLLAAPLAIGGVRTSRGHGIALGLLALIAYHELLAQGDAAASRELVAPWIGLWLPFAVFSLGSAVLCFRSAYRVPRRLWLEQILDRIDALLAAMGRTLARGR
jgi:lipopolysaccharide export system permease protein